MAVAALDRQRTCRARQRAGKILVTLEVSEADLVARLIDAGLPPELADDHDAITQWTQRLIEIFVQEKTQ